MKKIGIGMGIIAFATLYKLSKLKNKDKEQVINGENKASSDLANVAINKKIYVYISENGKKYHFENNCRSLNKNSEIQKVSLEHAESNGYKLCKWEE